MAGSPTIDRTDASPAEAGDRTHKEKTVLHITWVEFSVWSVLMGMLGMLIWDIVWTAMVSDARASTHFATASTRRRLIWIAIILLIATDIVGWVR